MRAHTHRPSHSVHTYTHGPSHDTCTSSRNAGHQSVMLVHQTETQAARMWNVPLQYRTNRTVMYGRFERCPRWWALVGARIPVPPFPRQQKPVSRMEFSSRAPRAALKRCPQVRRAKERCIGRTNAFLLPFFQFIALWYCTTSVPKLRIVLYACTINQTTWRFVRIVGAPYLRLVAGTVLTR